MKPIRQYLAEQLQHLVNDFSNIQVSCHYDEFDQSFGVEVLPAIVFKEDLELLDKRSDLRSEFLRIYPDESLGFYTDGSFIHVDKSDYVLTGNTFIPHLRPAKLHAVEVAVPKRKRKEPLHPYVSRAV